MIIIIIITTCPLHLLLEGIKGGFSSRLRIMTALFARFHLFEFVSQSIIASKWL